MSIPILILILVISTSKCQKQARIIFNSDESLETGDACVSVQDDVKMNGLCTQIQDCPTILTNIFVPKFSYTLCGYDGTIQIVCCPIKEESKINVDANMECRTANSNESGVMKLASECSNVPVYNPSGNNSKLVCCPVAPTQQIKKSCLRKRSNPLENLADPVQQVAGGVNVLYREYTHMAALGYNSDGEIEWKCGGSVISNRFVLTAAHCLIDSYYGPVLKVRLGVLNLLNDDSTYYCPTDVDVANLIPHPNYNRKFVYNDIGLIELANPVEYNINIGPICLPTSEELPQKYVSMGWGATGYAEDSSVRLLKIDQELFSYEECQNQYNYDRRFPDGIKKDTHICAGSRDSIQSTCQGDSGGPLISNKYFINRKIVYIYGIVSFGSVCGFANSSGVNTKVYPYVKWIEEKIYGIEVKKPQNDLYCNISAGRSPILFETLLSRR